MFIANKIPRALILHEITSYYFAINFIIDICIIDVCIFSKGLSLKKTKSCCTVKISDKAV